MLTIYSEVFTIATRLNRRRIRDLHPAGARNGQPDRGRWRPALHWREMPEEF